MSEIIIASIIEGVSNILMSVIPVIALLLGGRSYLKSKSTRDDLKTALNDLQFLLNVEREHINLHKENGHPANKRAVRCLASSNSTWSGRFTSARIKRKLSTLENQDKKVEHVTNRIR